MHARGKEEEDGGGFSDMRGHASSVAPRREGRRRRQAMLDPAFVEVAAPAVRDDALDVQLGPVARRHGAQQVERVAVHVRQSTLPTEECSDNFKCSHL